MIIREKHAVLFLAAVLVAVVWLGNFVFFLNSTGFYDAEFEKLGVNETLAWNAVNYVSRGEELSGEFNEEETGHFEDVRALFSRIKMFYYFSLILMTGAAVYLSMKMPHAVPKAFAVAGAASLALLGAAVLAGMNFEFFFDLVHKPFFEGDSYLFSEDSLIIRTFPMQFFEDAFRYLAVRVFVNSALFLGMGLIFVKYFRTLSKNFVRT